MTSSKNMTVPKTDSLHLLKVYGDIAFKWDLFQDTIDWQGPLNKLISPDLPLMTGSSFNNCLDPKNFWCRMKALSEASRHKKDTLYKAHYSLMVPGHEALPFEEEGEIVFKGEEPIFIKGKIRLSDKDVKKTEDLSGYDYLTGFPGKEILFETLASLLEQTSQSKTPGAYIAFAIDQMGYITCKYGIEALSEIVKSVADSLRKSIRFDDFIGRNSGVGLGVILKDCDRWGIVRASDRLSKSIEEREIKTSQGKILVKISAGGIVFPENGVTAQDVMYQAEKCLFEAQGIKGVGAAWTPYPLKTNPQLKRPQNAREGKRRTIDEKIPANS